MSEIVGKQHLDDALSKKNGVIICLSHFGAYKMILPALAFRGYKVNQVAIRPVAFVKKEWQSVVDDKIMEMEYQAEKVLPVNFIYIDKFLRPIFDALKKNEIVVFPLDGVTGTRRLPVKLLDRKAWLSSSAMEIAIKTGAVILPVFITRGNDERHRIVFEPPMTIHTEKPKNTVLQELLEEFANTLGTYIVKYPCHYGMFLYVAKNNPFPGGQTVFENL
jgi:KDO2-lipid IV(A) lauroyltransferase